MPVNAGQVIRVDLVADFDGAEDIVNVMQFRLDSPGSLTDEQVLDDIEDLLEALVAIIRALAGALTVWRRFRVQIIDGGLLIGERQFAAPIPGTAAGESGAPGVAGLVTMKTNVPKVVLRKYFGPLGEGVLQANGRLTAGNVTVLLNAGNFLRGPHNQVNGTYTFGYFSPKTQSFVVPNNTTVTDIPAYQRRRRQGVGS